VRKVSGGWRRRPLEVYRPYPKHYPSGQGLSGTGVTPGDNGVFKPADSANPAGNPVNGGLGSKDSKMEEREWVAANAVRG